MLATVLLAHSDFRSKDKLNQSDNCFISYGNCNATTPEHFITVDAGYGCVSTAAIFSKY